MGMAREMAKGISRTSGMAFSVRLGHFRDWPSEQVLIDEPLALAEERTSRLRRIYANASRDLWDGPAVFREAVAKHGGIQLDLEKRRALAYPISMLMWGELGAWIVAAELAERLEDPDARMAASSQVFDEARHFYVLRDYLALLHVPVPPLDPYFALGARRLLMARDLDLKLLAMQIVAEGTAQVIFRFLADGNVEPVLTEILPYLERDEARHVGLGTLHLPERLAKLSPAQAARLSSRAGAIADAFLMTQVRYHAHYRTLGLDPRELARRGDRMLAELSHKLGSVPGTGQPYLRAGELSDPANAARLEALFPPPGARDHAAGRLLRWLLDAGTWVLPGMRSRTQRA
jgi:hypothetical protein